MIVDFYRQDIKLFDIETNLITHTDVILGIESVSVEFISITPVNLIPGDYIIVENVKYYIFKAPDYSQNLNGYSYKFVLYHRNYIITHKIYTQKNTYKTNFTQSHNLRGFLELWLWNINTSLNEFGVDNGWIIGDIVDTPYREIQFTSINCLNVLNKLCEVFRLEFELTPGKVINFYNRVDRGYTIDLNDNDNEGNYELIALDNFEDFYTRAYIKGGNKNVPLLYQDENGYLKPTFDYIQDTQFYDQIKETTKIFKDEYPYYVIPIKNKINYNNKLFLIEVEKGFKDKLQVDTQIKFLTGVFTNLSFSFTYDEETNLTLINFDGYSEDLINQVNIGDLVTFENYEVPSFVLNDTQKRLNLISNEWFYNQNFPLCRLEVKFPSSFYGQVNSLPIGANTLFTYKGNSYNNLRLIKKDVNLSTNELTLIISNYWDIENLILSRQASQSSIILDGVEKLSELKDVSLTELKPEQVLKWDGFSWTNSEFSLNIAELDNRYAPKNHTHTWNQIEDKPLTDEQFLEILKISTYWKLDSNDNLYTERNVYSTKEVSAYGIGTGGGGGGGSSSLAELVDVNVTGVAANDLLTYNGTHWVPVSRASVGTQVSWGSTSNNYSHLNVAGVSKTVALNGHMHSTSEITGLGTLLDGKYDTPTGTTSQYIRGDGSLATFPTLISETELNTGTANTARLISALRLNTWADNKYHTISDFNLHKTNQQAEKHLTQTQLTGLINLINWWKLDGSGNLYTDLNVYSNKEVSAYGLGTGGGGGGIIETVYGYASLGGTFNNTNLTDTFNAYTTNQLYNRIVALEGGAALSITTTGSGNAITSVTKSGSVLTFTKGSTFSLSGHTHAMGEITGLDTALSGKQPLNASLTSISWLSGTTGLLRKTAANTYTLDTSAYITGNQNITLSGDVTGSGTTAITTSIAASVITGKTLTGYSIGSNAAVAATDTILGAFGKVQAQINARPGTVTSVSLTAPTGFSVTGSPITSAGTLTLAFASGYSLPTTAKQTNWDTVYNWYNTVGKYWLLDSTNDALYTTKNVYSQKELSAYGAGSGGSGGGGLIETVYGYASLGGTFNNSILTDTFNAYTINQLHSRINSLEAGSALTINTTGSGNAVTTITKSGTVITATKGLTFMQTSHAANSITSTNINNWNTAYGWGNHVGLYLPLSGGTISGTIITTQSSTLPKIQSTQTSGNAILRMISTNNGYDRGFGMSLSGELIFGEWATVSTLSSSWWTVYHSNNLSLSTLGGVPTSRTVTAGNGLSGGGTLAADRTITLGTPSTLSASSTNGVTASSHTHSITTTSTGAANTIVQTNASGGTTFTGTVTAPTFSGALSGNSTTATTLQTARTINGTSFNGSANITTSNWGTARTLTIGNTGKSVNGSANVSWSLSEIGAAPASHTHSYLPLTGGTLTGDLSILAGNTDKFITFDYNGTNTYNWRIGYLGTGSGNENYFTVQSSKSTGGVYFDALRLELETLNAQFFGTVTAPTFIGALTGNASTATTLQTARTINGTSFNGSANVTTSNWGTARTITIGGTGKSVNGSANVTWATSEIAAQSAIQLATARTIWGQSFNGTGNISGAFSGATTGTFSSTLSANRIIVTSTSNEKHLEFSRSDYNYITSKGHIGFITGGTETGSANQQVWIHSNGNTKIGAGSSSVPAYTLDVNGTGRFIGTVTAPTFAGALTGNASSATKLETARTIWGRSFDGTGNVTGNISNTGNITPLATATHDIGTSSLMYERAYIRRIDTQSGYVLRFNVAGNEYMTINTSGNVGIGTTSPSQKLHVAGNIVATGEITAYVASDKRLKELIKPIDSPLDKITKLNPVSYKWNEEAFKYNSGKTKGIDYGLIAQDVENIIPEVVHGIYEDKYKSIDYIKLIPFLIGAIKELKFKLDKYEKNNSMAG